MDEIAPVTKKSNLRWWILLTVIIGTFLGRLDETIVNLALPKIISDFGITVSGASWIATAYILANTAFVPIWGKLGDTIGRKKVYLWGFSIFIFGSILAGLSWNLSSMIVFRIIQSIASSADYPTAMAILAVTFEHGRERAQALGIWSSSFAAAIVFGPLLGGPLIDHFGWRSVFMINIPIGVLGMLMAVTFINESVSQVKTKFFDWWGAITLGGVLSALVLVLDQGSTWGWLSINSILCYLSIILLFVIFLKIERSVPEPIVDIKFFKIPAFVNTLVNNFIVFMGMMGGVFLIPIFAQTFLGMNATQSGYLFIPMAISIIVAAPLGGRLIGKVQARFVIFGSTIVAAIGIFFLTRLSPTSNAFDIAVPLAVMTFGMGFGMAQRTNIIASVVPQSEIGVASSVLALVRNIAGAFGIAIFATIVTDRTNTEVSIINGFSKLSSHLPSVVQQYIALIEMKAQVNAYDYVFWVATTIIFLGSFTILFLKLKHERTDIKVHVE